MDLAVDENMPILKKNRLSTGISDLDLILEGGLINPANIMLIGPSGLEKNALGYHFVSSISYGEAGVIICGQKSPSEIIDKAASFGVDLKKKNIYFVDCYSSTLGKTYESTDRIKVVPGPGALNDLSLALNEIMRENTGKKLRVVYDTLSSFALYSAQDSIRKFLSVVGGRLKTAGATTLYLVDEGVHDRTLLGLLEQAMDRKLIISDQSGKLSITLPDVEIPIPIKMGPAGLSVV
ncbi:hypothetical protein HY990_00310 [Candidatus Micrarchaeota archaeon]|nr:hypothetical protein [Candidatus Micrarchaeota archaeon]